MEITRITYRVPKKLMLKVKLLAKENQVSLNTQLTELIRLGIQYYLIQTDESQLVKNDEN